VKPSFKLAFFLLVPLAALVAGCSSSTTASPDASFPDGSFDATIQNQCTNASSSNVCQATPCGPTFTNVQDLGCGSTTDLCCAPNGDASGGSDGNIDVGHFPDTGVDAGHDAGHDATAPDAGHDSGHDAGHDAGHPPDASHDAPVDAPGDHFIADAKADSRD
jgi:hypothetical protein